MTRKLVSLRAVRSSLLIAAALAGATSLASAQTAPAATAPAAAAPVAPAPAAAPEAAPPAAAAAPAEAPPAPAEPVVTMSVGAGFPQPAPEPAASPVSAEAAGGSIAVTPPVAEEAKPNQASVTFKPGKGVDIKSADGNFLLNTSLRFQFLDELHAPAAAGSEVRNHLVMRRVRLTFGGHVFSEDIKYKLDIALGTPELGREPSTVVNKSDNTRPPVDGTGNDVALSSTGDTLQQGPIIDAYLEFQQHRDLNVRVGQSKIPFSLERLMSDGALRSVDRSLASEEFSFDRDIGIDVRSGDLLGIDKLRYYAGVYSGEGRNASLKSVGAGDLGHVYAVRVEMFPMGTFDIYDAPDLAAAHDARLAIGVAYAFLQADATSPEAKRQLGTVLESPGTIALVDYNSHNFTADVSFKLCGFSAMSAFYFRKVDPFIGARDGIGWVLQAGYLMSQEMPIEVQAGFAMVRPTERATSGISEGNELGGGFNYYFYGHGLKLQAEYAHTWDQGVAGLADNRIRLQLQAAL
jgi:phosphate-selective porin OprO and OprP